MKWKAKRALHKNKVFVELINRLQERLGLKAFEVIDFHNAGDLDWLVIALPNDHSVSMSINTYIPRDDFQVFLSSPGAKSAIEGVEAESFDELVAVIQKHFHHD
jgi:hypothetical protein